ncbi:MAG: glutathione peroxidase [Candidatus Zixiibacteriota bacterium]
MTIRLIISAVFAVFVLTACGNAGQDNAESDTTTMTHEEAPMQAVDYKSIPFKTITGEDTSLKDFEGHVVLLVNVASQCGYTKQYAGLEELYRSKKDDGLVIIGFPANNFGGQEPGSNEEILNFCQTKFDVTFPMMSKISVKGDDIHGLYKYLTEESSLPGDIKWNFGKFLLDKHGNLVARYDSAVTPEDEQLTSKIDELLALK